MSFGETGIMIGDFQIVAYYGIILMLGAVAAAFLADFRARRSGMDPEKVWDGLIWVIIGGVIGARLWHIFTPPPSMLVFDATTGQMENPYFAGGTVRILDMLDTRKGGLGVPGAVIGGGLALLWYTRRKKTSFLLWADIAAPCVALGQAIGRWGNFINQELYGRPTDLPWGIFIAAEGQKMHPLFLYESLWNLANMALLLWMGKRFAGKLKEGDLLLTYMIGYPLGRFLLEFMRLDSPRVGSININQTVMLIVALAAVGVLVWRHRKPAITDAAPSDPQ